MPPTSTKPTTTIALQVRIQQWMSSRNITLCDSVGMKLPNMEIELNGIGILGDIVIQPRRFFGLLPSPPRRKFLGYLSIYGNRWIMRAYGEEAFQQLTEIANNLGKHFDVIINVELTSLEPKLESLIEDYDL